MKNLANDNLVELAKKYGTPVYIYNGDVIATQYKKISTAFNQINAKFFYAAKALSNINILKLICSLGANIDCVSINEVKLALYAGFKPCQIIFTPNCIDFSELETAINLKIFINIDNIALLEQFGNKYADKYPIFIRLNPHILAGGNFKISVGHIDSKFGISIHQIRHVERIVKTLNIKVIGLHMHTGSEIRDISVWVRGLEILLSEVEIFPLVKYLDLGSGFKVKYQSNDDSTDLKELALQINNIFSQYRAKTGRKFELWFEPGKFLVSEAGSLVVKVNTVKQTPATTFVGVNSGFNHLIRPMLYDSYHEIINLSNLEGDKRLYTVVGNLCEMDTFAVDRRLPEAHPGDYLAILNAGAYGYEMSSSFNSRLKPPEVLAYQGTDYLIRRRENFEDLLALQIDTFKG